MKDTGEQINVIEHQGNARVNACAGSGKTTTLLGYSKARPNARILYIVYNKAMKNEAIHKFRRKGVENVDVETAHSLAYSQIMAAGGYVLHKNANLKPHDVLEFCKIPENNGKGFILAKHVLDCLTKFCNSDTEKVHHVDYTGGSDLASRQYVARHLDTIYGHAKRILYAMYDGELDMTHDVYLKLFQLQHPELPYTHILFDEGQDANPCMLDIFKKQSAVKIIVGDTFQSIYSFNGAVNSLETLDYPLFRLTNSFRFGGHVAKTAMHALNLKRFLGQSLNGFVVNGIGQHIPGTKTTGVIARSNIGLLQKSIEMICEDGMSGAFEGGLRSYTCLSGGGGLFDVLNLHLRKPERIRDVFYQSFKHWDDLEDYQESTNDRDLGLMINVVKKYGAALFPLLNEIKEKQVPRANAEVIFSSVHRSKGQEYDNVILANDFIHGNKLLKLLGGGGRRNTQGSPPNIKELSEEVNILYVAVTRTKGDNHIPFDILPDEVPLPQDI